MISTKKAMLTSVIHGSAYSRKTMLSSYFIYIRPECTTTDLDQLTLSIDSDNVELGEVDNETTLG
jgi:hypothetical protein